jgi:hypothetical protein
MSRILILGCGDLAWGRPSTSPIFGREWSRGRLSDKICFGPEDPQPGDAPGLDWVSLAEELDRRMAWCPAAALESVPRITVLHSEPMSPPPLPAWQELAGIQAQWASREVGGAGVLVTPGDWQDAIQGRQLLAAWAGEGWSWAPLEEVLRKRFASGVRVISASGSFLRVTQPEGGLVLANGPEAALALGIVPAILDRALEELAPELASRWRLEEEPLSGWYVYQQMTHKITKALREDRTRVELGGSAHFRISPEGRMIIDERGISGVLFRFSSAEAQEQYQALLALRLTVELTASPVSWWKKVSQPGFLRSPEGAPHPGIQWEDRKTILLEGTEIRKLSSYLTLRNVAQEEVDPARFEEALELGSPLPMRPKDAAAKAPIETPAPCVAMAVDSVPVGPAEPAMAPAASPSVAAANSAAPLGLAPSRRDRPAAPLPQPEGDEKTEEAEKVTTLAAFLPNQLSLEVPHRPDRVQVWLDGRRVESANVRHSTRRGLYTIEGVAVPHGAVVRVDFEPPQE